MTKKILYFLFLISLMILKAEVQNFNKKLKENGWDSVIMHSN